MWGAVVVRPVWTMMVRVMVGMVMMGMTVRVWMVRVGMVRGWMVRGWMGRMVVWRVRSKVMWWMRSEGVRGWKRVVRVWSVTVVTWVMVWMVKVMSVLCFGDGVSGGGSSLRSQFFPRACV